MKKILGKTEDGVNIYEGDIVYGVYRLGLFHAPPCVVGNNTSINNNHVIDFSTKKLANDYISMNDKKYSYNDIIKILKELEFNSKNEILLLLKNKLLPNGEN
jgi:hypothetical protein